MAELRADARLATGHIVAVGFGGARPARYACRLKEMLMDERQANSVADALGGEAWQSGGDVWLVLLRRAGGRLVVFSDDVVCEYPSEASFEENRPEKSILLG